MNRIGVLIRKFEFESNRKKRHNFGRLYLDSLIQFGKIEFEFNFKKLFCLLKMIQAIQEFECPIHIRLLQLRCSPKNDTLHNYFRKIVIFYLIMEKCVKLNHRPSGFLSQEWFRSVFISFSMFMSLIHFKVWNCKSEEWMTIDKYR